MYDELFCEGTTWHSLWARMFTAFSERDASAGLNAAAVSGGRSEPVPQPEDIARAHAGGATRARQMS